MHFMLNYNRDLHLYQFITYQFLHADIMHIGANMLFLYVFGNNVNKVKALYDARRAGWQRNLARYSGSKTGSAAKFRRSVWNLLFGIEGAFSRLGVVLALTFVGMPFAVRTLQPVLENLDRGVEEAAATLGAGRLRTFLRVIAPTIFPTIITGFALSFARAVGEYGSIVFISGNKIFKTEIAPFIIVVRLDQYDYLGATAIAAVLLVVSFIILAVINYLEVWSRRFHST